jgi:hypothetical protein
MVVGITFPTTMPLPEPANHPDQPGAEGETKIDTRDQEAIDPVWLDSPLSTTIIYNKTIDQEPMVAWSQ